MSSQDCSNIEDRTPSCTRKQVGSAVTISRPLTKPKLIITKISAHTNQQLQGGCTSTKRMIHGTRTVNSHLPLLLMVGRCLSRPDMRVGHWDGRQARGFPDLTRPKFQPKSATSGGCRSANCLIHGQEEVENHLLLLVMVGRWQSRPDIRIWDQDGC